MDRQLLESLSRITEEETEILNGKQGINRELYYRAENRRTDEVDSSLVLTHGKLIDMRPHTRFVHFPRHTHNYVEFVYMCQGSTTHIIDGKSIHLNAGDLLFMNQHAVQEILPAGKDDIAVNFMILPQFFDSVIRTLEQESSALRDFLISCLTDKDMGGNYLYFDASDILPVQNLMENLIWIMVHNPPNRRTQSQSTVALLFMTLIGHADHVHVSESSYEQNLILRLLNYIETQYRNAALADFAAESGEDIYTLSRLISRFTGKTFKALLIERRLGQAVWLLENTDLGVTDISYLIGYENTSYFHRLFRSACGCSPREYRKNHKHPEA